MNDALDSKSNDPAPSRPARRWLPSWRASVIGAITSSVVLAAVLWAGITILLPTTPDDDEKSSALAVVTRDSIESTLGLNAKATWPVSPGGANAVSGVVTEVSVTAGQRVSAGEVLYSVDMRPVAAAAGRIPSYRDVGKGMKGDDVEQVQQFLSDVGVYFGTVDGEAGENTETAIKTWQRKHGLSETGILLKGDVMFLPTLPARVMLDAKVVYRGAVIGPGVPVVSVLADSPVFSIPLQDAQVSTVHVGLGVDLKGPAGELWRARVAGIKAPASDPTKGGSTSPEAMLEPATSSSICASSCDSLGPESEVLVPATIMLVPRTDGLVVPASAITTDAQGNPVVIDAEGTPHPVLVGVTAKGMTLVEGVDEGLRVRVPGDAASSSPAPRS